MIGTLRSLWRSARDRPAFRPLVARLDRLWWARAIAHADIVDLDYVRAQTGRSPPRLRDHHGVAAAGSTRRNTGGGASAPGGKAAGAGSPAGPSERV